ncbi:hypothetical protein FRB94_014294 [Tulasnella sp. JGI-2019a]|nr:hypothetical protein FRB94_014294 [Tulasnella sp. JGI-2019a]
MQTSSTPSYQTSLLNFYADQTPRSLPSVPAASRTGASNIQFAPYECAQYTEQPSAYDPGQAEFQGSSLTMQQLDGTRPIIPTEDRAPDPPQPTMGNQKTQDKGEGSNPSPGKRAALACVTCRSRKVRCDGARPSCSNCRQRHCAASCSYDEAPRRRGPDRKPGRIRGPSGSSAALEKKKQVRKQIQQEAATKARKTSAPAVPLQPPQDEVDYTQATAPVLKQIPVMVPAPLETQEPNVSSPPAATLAYPTTIDLPMPVSRIFTPTTFSLDGLSRNVVSIPIDNQAQVHAAPDQRLPELGALANSDMPISFRQDYTKSPQISTPRVQGDARQRSRPSLNDLLIPSSNIGMMPPLSSSSSQFPPSSMQLNNGYSSHQYELGHQSIYAPTPGTTEPTTTSWIPASPSRSHMQPDTTTEWLSYDKGQHWHASDQPNNTVPYEQQVVTSDLQVWDPQEQTHGFDNRDPSRFQNGRASHSFHTAFNSIIREPSLHFSCDTWWDTVLYIYGTDQTSISTSSDSSQLLPWPSSRYDAAVEISNDVYSFFKVASNWLSFINVPLFLGQFHHTDYRTMMQPALVLGILAYFKFLQSSQGAKRNGEGAAGTVMLDETEKMWRKSVMLRELAQAAFDASYNAGWIDTPLAQAAWILALYEFSAHRDTNAYRMESSMIILDNVVHVLNLRTLDRTNPRVPIFKAGAVPALGRPRPNGQVHRHYDSSMDLGSQGHVQLYLKSIEPPRPAIQYQSTTQQTPFDLYRSVNNSTRTHASGSGIGTTKGCPCHALSLAGSPEAQKSTPLWLSTPKWDPDADLADIRREEGRRLVWSSITVLCGDATARLALGWPQLNLYASKPENYALLLPGEDLYASRPEVDAVFSGKESTWALYGRTMLLWYACVSQIAAIKKAAPVSFLNGNVNGGLAFTPEQLATAGPNHADFAMRAWMETLAIEEALNEHTCDGEKATMYQAREHLFTIRMFITGGFRQYIPQPRSGVDFSRLDREKAMQWLNHQNNVATQLRTVINAEHGPAHYLLVKRPYVIWWEMSLIGRAMQLWVLDHSLTFAMDVALNIFPVLKWFERVWPCPEQQRRSVSLMANLTHICRLLGKQIPV